MMARSILRASQIGRIHWCKTQRRCFEVFLLATHHRSIHLVESKMGAGAWGLWPSLRFPSPLIETDLRSYRIRLSDWLHCEAHARHLAASVRGIGDLVYRRSHERTAGSRALPLYAAAQGSRARAHSAIFPIVINDLLGLNLSARHLFLRSGSRKFGTQTQARNRSGDEERPSCATFIRKGIRTAASEVANRPRQLRAL